MLFSLCGCARLYQEAATIDTAEIVDKKSRELYKPTIKSTIGANDEEHIPASSGHRLPIAAWHCDWLQINYVINFEFYLEHEYKFD